MARFSFSTLVVAMILCPYVGQAQAKQDDKTPKPKTAILEPATDEGEAAIAQFKYPENLKCELYAAEPDVANIVAFHRDYQGNLYVCETFRQEKGVEDNRRHAHWMDEELAAQTVQDRIDYIRKYIPDADTAYTEHDDRIRLLRDTNGNGKPDSVGVFSDGYNKLEMGTGAGVLSYRGKVYYTCIPDLFELQDTNNDGVADVRKSLHTGYGVRFAFRGHDMHGLIVGPDGRLYFSIGDRGYNISPTIKDPASGAVFRCELDGSNLEVIATGLRNPQELAFDDYGNLFTGDNNSDSGDMARWTEIVEGGDTGWRMYYQYQEDRGPFNREKIWYPYNEDTPAYIVPPIINISDGPSGLEYYPGTGFGDEFKGRFFLCDFRGDASRSGVRSFRNQAKGATWELVEDEQPFWNMLVTDIDFGSDGKLYASDWVFGWNGENKGRLYTFEDPVQQETAIVKQVEALLRSGLKNQKTDDLKALIGHADQRIRQEAQFELVDRGDVLTLKSVARDTEQDELARIHSIWGLGQLGRGAARNKKSFDTAFLNHLLGDANSQVVCAAAGIASDIGFEDAPRVAKLLEHSNHRVRYCGAMALGKMGTENEVEHVANMLVDNADKDPILRHGGIMALKGILMRNVAPDTSLVPKLANHDSRSVRIALCITMRKVLTSNAENSYKAKLEAQKVIGPMLADSDKQIVLEAARIIHDVNVEPLMIQLASLIDNVDAIADSDPLLRRVISANVQAGVKKNAEALAKLAMNEDVDEARRIDAVKALGDWAAPPARVMVLHDWRPTDPKSRNVMDARNAVESNFSALTSGAQKITSAAIAAAGDLSLTAIGMDLEKVVLADATTPETRVSALRSLGQLKHEGLDKVLDQMESQFDTLSGEMPGVVIDMMAKTDEARALRLIETSLDKGKMVAKQSALETMGKMKSDESAALLASLLKRVSADDLDPTIRLDVLLAAEKRTEQPVKDLLDAYVAATVKADDPASNYINAANGGNHDKGSTVFYGKTEVSCVRCHRIDGTGGKVGPDLSSIGLTKDRTYLLESIVHPNKVISEGFAQEKVLTIDGELLVGIVKRESEKTLVLMDADGKEIVIEQDDIDDRKPGKSSMPDDLVKQLTKKEIRDLVEFLVYRKSKPQNETEHE